MVDNRQGFGELRSLLDRQPTVALFEQILAELDDWERGPLEQEALPYLAGRMEEWPDPCRKLSGERALNMLEEAPWRPEVQLTRHLDLSVQELDDARIEALAPLPNWAAITSLDLSKNPLTGEGLSQLLSSGHLGQLRCLRLDLNTRAQIHEMLVLPDLQGQTQLERLTMFGCRLDDKSLRHMTQNAQNLFGQLRVLDLYLNNIGPRGFRDMLASLDLRELTELNLGYNQIAEGIAALADASLPSLEVLNMSHNALTDVPLLTFAAGHTMPRLHTLQLSLNTITDKGLKALARSESFPALRQLDLWSCDISDEGLQILLDSELGQSLEKLEVFDNQISSRGAKMLAEAEWLDPEMRAIWARRLST